MRLKLDENLGRRTAVLFTDAGHDVATVHGQEMQGATDRELFDTCRAEGRVLVTLDLDFTNPLRFPPAGSPGLAVLRVKETPAHVDMLQAAGTLVVKLGEADITGCLWVVDRQRVRQYERGGT